MSKRKGSNKENLEQTRALFLELAEQEFLEQGYAKASTTRIVENSGMARGSLYYHFKDKQDLFRAVYETVMVRIASQIHDKVDSLDDPWEGFMAAAHMYFEICAHPQDSRIFLIESQAALPYSERYVVVSRTIRPVLVESLDRLAAAGYFDGQNKDMLAIFVFGALGESGRIINVMPNRQLIMDRFFETFKWAMDRLR